MVSIHYPYCLTKFVVMENYQKSRYAKEEETKEFSYPKLMFKNVTSHNNTDTLEGKLKTIYVEEKEVGEYLNHNNVKIIYNPLIDTKELYLEMNKIELLDEKSLLKFIKEYGIPFNYHINESSSGIYPTELFTRNEEKLFLSMDVMMFLERLKDFKKILKMWNDIREENVEAMKLIKRDFMFQATDHDFYREHLSVEEYLELTIHKFGVREESAFNNLKEMYINNPEKLNDLAGKASEFTNTWNVMQGESLVNVSMAYLNLTLKNVDSGHLSTTLIKDQQNKAIIAPAIRFNDLLEVAFYQLKEAVFKNTRLMKCEHCGALFMQAKGNQRFCSPLPNRKYSTCQNTYNQRLKRKNKKELQNKSK